MLQSTDSELPSLQKVVRWAITEMATILMQDVFERTAGNKERIEVYDQWNQRI